MGSVIDLEEAMALPDCISCKDWTKRRVRAVIICGEYGCAVPIYRCRNLRCREKKRQAELFWLRYRFPAAEEREEGLHE